MSPDNLVTLGATAVTGVFAVWGARSARRTKRQEARDDFAVFTQALKEQVAELKREQATQQEQITGQGAAIAWLVIDRRSLVSTIRNAKLKPPPARPIPDRARPYLDHVDL